VTALLVIAVLVVLYVAWRIYSQIETERKDRAIARSIQALPKEPDAFGEKFQDPFPLKMQTLEEWLKEHPEPPPPPQHPLPAEQELPHVRKRKGKK
jgi:hypothetical protein